MRFTDKGRSRGYLHGVLLDGRKPFLYRRGVRSLLGVPDGGVGVTYAPPLPPADFQYVHRAGPDAPRPGSLDGDPEVVKEYPEKIVRSINAGEIAEQDASPIEPRTSAPAAMHLPAGRKGASPDIDRSKPAAPRSRSGEERAPDVVPRAATPPHDVKPSSAASQSLEVPGISRAARDFPALRSTVAPEELAIRRDEAKGASTNDGAREDRSARELPAEPDGARAPGGYAHTRETPPVNPSMPSPSSRPRLRKEMSGRDEASGARDPRGADRASGQVDDPIEGGRRSAGVIERIGEREIAIPAAARSVQMPPRIRSAAARSEAVEEGPYLEPADPTAGALSIRGALESGRGGRRAEGVEQIVERVIARRASEEGWDRSARRNAPEPPAQVVVVERKGQAEQKIPCAFWERSYLHRFRIRTLR